MENGMLFALVLFLLFLFGYGYNLLVNWMKLNKYEEGSAPYLMIGGTLATLAGAAFLIGWRDALLVLACFGASGFWMVVGAWQRRHKDEKRDLEDAMALAQEALNDEEDTWRVCLAAGNQPGERF